MPIFDEDALIWRMMDNVSPDAGEMRIAAGSVATLDLGSAALEVTRSPDWGRLTINPDGTLALVLEDPGRTGRLDFTARLADQGEVDLQVQVREAPIVGGWGAGDHYTFAVDAAGRSVIEPGETHRKVYVSGSKDALSIEDIARAEGLSKGQIDADWLAAHPEYGGSEGKALDTEAGTMLWEELTRLTDAQSHWLLFERGHEYEDHGRLISRGIEGESALHPSVIGAWGTGAAPVMLDKVMAFQDPAQNVVVRDLDVRGGLTMLGGKNYLLEGLDISREETVIQRVERVTLRQSEVLDAVLEKPRAGDTWDPGTSKISGVYASKSDSVLIEQVLADHNSWGEGYDPDLSGSKPQPPSKFSHNFYIQSSVEDLTFRDNVSIQGASFGAQLRPGGFIENNVFVANNAGLLVHDGGNYSLIRDNLVTLAGYKQADAIGTLSMGIHARTTNGSLIDNIVAHLSEPTDLEAWNSRVHASGALKQHGAPFYDDTLIYNWITKPLVGRTNPDTNLPDAPEAQLDGTSVKSFVEDVLGKRVDTDGASELATWLRANWDEVDGAQMLLDHFQAGFEMDAPERGRAETLRFVPDARGEGFRWDNDLNWSTGDLPGTMPGDRVDLGGNRVVYSGTTDLARLDLGEGGELVVRQGRLEIDSLQAGADARIETGLAGQIWIDGYSGGQTLEIDVAGGRFANTGRVTGDIALDVTGGEALLVAGRGQFDLGETLRIEGSGAKVGFDGQGGGAAQLKLLEGAELAWVADGGGVSAIREVRSGHWGTRDSDIRSQVDLGAGEAHLSLDLGALSGGGSRTLIAVDQLTGGVGEVDITGISSATLRLDYQTDRLDLITGTGIRGQALDLVGSGAAETFHAAAGISTRIEGYGRNDSVDLSALVETSATLRLARAAEGNEARILAGSSTLATLVDGGTLEQVTVRIDGTSRTLTMDGVSEGPVEGPVESPVEGPVEAPNRAPVASAATASGEADEAIRGRLSARDPDGDALTFALVDGPDRGSVRIASDGSFRFDPGTAFDALAAGETAVEWVTFAVEDGSGGRDQARLRLEVTGIAGPAPEPKPAPEPEPEPTMILGTSGRDRIEGTDDDDILVSRGGRLDEMWGGAGADGFVFGAESTNGVIDLDWIYDFDVAEDRLLLTRAAKVERISTVGEQVWVTLAGDGDRIVLEGEGLAAGLVEIETGWAA